MAATPPSKFQAPHPGSQAMPQWDAGELIDAPVVTWRNMVGMIGPGLVMGAAAIGGGEWLAGPAVTAKYGGSLLWVASLSIIFQVLYNIEISRYTLYTGEPIFTGKFRIQPGPWFWLVAYFLFDWGSLVPYLAVNAAPPLEALLLGRSIKPDDLAWDWWFHKIVCTTIYSLTVVPLIFGGKVYNSLKVVMSGKLILVCGFLLFLGIFYSKPESWGEIVSGFFKVGNVPVKRAEDTNGNGRLDPGETDFDGDKRADVIEKTLEKDAKGNVTKFDDVDGDKKQDGDNVDNAIVLATHGEWPNIDLTLIAMIAGLAAIAGNGGLTNTPISNFTRDQGWGMGHHVGAIPSVVGGQGITLSHVGCVFDVNEESLSRWRRWYRHIVRDQAGVWMLACFVGVALPSILSVEFLPRGTNAKGWEIGTKTAEGVQEHINHPPDGTLIKAIGLDNVIGGEGVGKFFRGCTLFCGFLVLITSSASTMDGFIRRWVDVVWTASPRLRKLDTSFIRILYFRMLLAYTAVGIAIIWSPVDPKQIFEYATCGYNIAFALSAWHTIVINTTLLPPKIRPGWLIRVGLGLAGCYFMFLGVMSALRQFRLI